MICLLMCVTTPTEVNSEVECVVVEHTTDEPEEVIVEPLEDKIVKEPTYISLGEFKLTAYCPCEECSGGWGKQTSTGVVATEGVTIAVDPNVIPYGTKVYINGHEYTAQDCGGAINGKDIDIFMDSHSDCKNFGVQYVEVFVKGDN